MAVDYLSTLNSKGSGLNVTQIVDSLVQAEIQPQRSLISKSQDSTELKISELASLKARASSFQDSFTAISFDESFEIDNGNNAAFELSNSDGLISAEEFTAQIQVNQLAKKQTLLFSGFEASDALVGSINLEIAFGEVAANLDSATDETVFERDLDKSIAEVSLFNATLTDLAQSLDDLDGISSEVVAIGEAEYGLAIYSDFGKRNALQITSDHAQINTASLQKYKEHQQVAASDSIIKLNGIELTRSTNDIDDVIAGTNLKLKSLSDDTITISAAFDTEKAKEKMLDFVEELNGFKIFLRDITQRGLDSKNNSAFASDATIRGIYSQLNNLIRQPIAGYQSGDIYFAQLGLMTERDGSVSLDESKFETFFNENQNSFFAINENRFAADSEAISVIVSDPSRQTSGSFEFEYDHASGNATLDGRAMTKTIIGTDTIFRLDESGFQTLQLTCASDEIPNNSSINLGISAFRRIDDLISGFLSTNGVIGEKEQLLTADLQSYELELFDLTMRENASRERYTEQFVNMEQIVTRLKSTGEYITTIMDAWNKEDN